MLRKDFIEKTCAPKDAYGMFTSKRVLKTWKEDFLDEDSGEVVTIERNEVLIDNCTPILEEQIECMLKNGITEVTVSDAPRAKERVQGFSWIPFAVKVSTGSMAASVVVRSDSIYSAMHLAADYSEDYTNEVFGPHAKYNEVMVLAAQRINGVHFLSRTAADIENEKKALNTDKDAPVKMPFKVKATWVDFELPKPKRIGRDYVAWGYDIVDAKNVVAAYVKKEKNTINPNNGLDTLVIKSATPFKCDAFIPYDICNEYITEQHNKLQPDNE